MIPYLNRHFLRSAAKTVVRGAIAVAPAGLQRRLRTAVEKAAYSLTPAVDNLPPIFHYWSNAYLRPQFLSLGFASPHEFFVQQVRAVVEGRGGRPDARILSIGSGRCELEVAIASELVAAGRRDFRFRCVDINAGMLEAASGLADRAGVRAHFEFVAADVGQPVAGERFDIVIANECLHHFVELERIFDAIHGGLADDGVFLTADVIGRNGHQLWPEALVEVERFWDRLPDAYRFDRSTGVRSRGYRDYDHSGVGFEGIRAQDILRLLVERFHFEVFAAHTCIVLPFVERRFGWNFDPSREFDTRFIDAVAERDALLLASGQVKPTQLVAAMRKTPVAATRSLYGLTPAGSIRVP